MNRERRERLLLAIFLAVLAPVGAAVLIAVLLLFGAAPRLVFAPGHALKALLTKAGAPAPNAVGVLATVACWWALIAAAGLLWQRRRRP